nr:hypothetical protein Iba_chr06cCG6030 [Ipomoea batatas]
MNEIKAPKTTSQAKERREGELKKVIFKMIQSIYGFHLSNCFVEIQNIILENHHQIKNFQVSPFGMELSLGYLYIFCFGWVTIPPSSSGNSCTNSEYGSVGRTTTIKNVSNQTYTEDPFKTQPFTIRTYICIQKPMVGNTYLDTAFSSPFAQVQRVNGSACLE